MNSSLSNHSYNPKLIKCASNEKNGVFNKHLSSEIPTKFEEKNSYNGSLSSDNSSSQVFNTCQKKKKSEPKGIIHDRVSLNITSMYSPKKNKIQLDLDYLDFRLSYEIKEIEIKSTKKKNKALTKERNINLGGEKERVEILLKQLKKEKERIKETYKKIKKDRRRKLFKK
ncbi:hypothetical protein QTN25_006079 [Entamoeba marina]